MPSVFLSHNTHDKPFARRLAKRLAAHGISVWLDEAKLRIGDSIIDRVAEAIRDVDFVIVVMSKNAARSPWVQKELSLAMSKELSRQSVSVLPVRVDETPMPSPLGDKLYADFRDPRGFSLNVRGLLNAMGVRGEKPKRGRGLSVEWTEEGPRIVGHQAAITPTEGNALLTRWFKWFDKLLPREIQRLGENNQDAWGATRVRATLKACQETYKRTVYEEDLVNLSSELGRKANLFYIFMERMHFETSDRGRKGAV